MRYAVEFLKSVAGKPEVVQTKEVLADSVEEVGEFARATLPMFGRHASAFRVMDDRGLIVFSSPEGQS